MSRAKKTSNTSIYDNIKKDSESIQVIWKDEYERKLDKVDRILLTTLYSITDMNCSSLFLEECFTRRIEKMPDIDVSIHHFRQSLERLQGSFLKTVDQAGKQGVSVSNPSVNDFLDQRLKENQAEQRTLRKDLVSVRQLARMLPPEEFEEAILQLMQSGGMRKLVFESELEACARITFYVQKKRIFDAQYRPYLLRFLNNLVAADLYTDVKSSVVYARLLNEDLRRFYELDAALMNPDVLQAALQLCEFEEEIAIIESFYNAFCTQEAAVALCREALKDAVDIFCQSIDVERYLDWNDVSIYGDEEGVDCDRMESNLAEKALELATEELFDSLRSLPQELHLSEEEFGALDWSVSGAAELVESYLAPDFERDDDSPQRSSEDEIDLMFQHRSRAE